MKDVYTVTLLEAEMLPAYARGMAAAGEPITMEFSGTATAFTPAGAFREAYKAFKADECRVRREYLAKYGWDNATPIYRERVLKKNGKRISIKY